MALNMDLKDKKMTKKIVFRQSGGGQTMCKVDEKKTIAPKKPHE